MENPAQKEIFKQHSREIKRIHKKQMTGDRYSLYACASLQSTVPSIQTSIRKDAAVKPRSMMKSGGGSAAKERDRYGRSDLK